MLRLAFPLLLAFSAASALAGPNNAVAVLDIQGTGIQSDLLPTLTEILTVEISDLGLYKVVAGRDVQAMLGFEKQKDVLGCTDAACLAEIGGALGVDRIVASHIGVVGSTYVVNIKLINIRMADTEARVYETVRGETDALINTIRKSVQKLLGVGSQAATALGGAPAPKPATVAQAAEPTQSAAAPASAAASTAEPPASVRAEATSGGRKIGVAPWVFWGVGAVALGLGTVSGLEAKSKETLANDRTEPGSQAAIDQATSAAMRANIFLGVGGVAVAGGFAWWLLFGEPSGPATALVPVVGAEAVGLAFAGRF